MKKLFVLLLIILLLVGCGSGGSDDVLEIGERFFIAEMTNINMNAGDYVGRTIRYEGMFRNLHWEATGEDYHQVIRTAFGCCGNDGIVGFEVYLGDIPPLPNDAWVEVEGVLEWYEVGGTRFLRVRATSITELEERGSEFVTA